MFQQVRDNFQLKDCKDWRDLNIVTVIKLIGFSFSFLDIYKGDIYKDENGR